MFFTFATIGALFRRRAAQPALPDVDFAFLANRNEAPQARVVEAAYDAAQTTPDNRRHWRWADALSAKSANGPWVRSIIRQRARYEADNNPLVDGILNTLANDMIGHGPVLQLNSPSEEFNQTTKLEWDRWAKAVRLWSKLRQARRAKAVDGESFLLLVYDPTVSGPVKWNVRVVECDRVTTPDMPWEDPRRTDGIVYDEHGNPIEYHLLRAHPGDQGVHEGYWVYDPIPAQYVLHWFSKKRPGQLRGVSEMAPQLGTVADLRRFSKATIKKKEVQAEIHGFIEQAASPDPNGMPGQNAIDPWTEFDVEMGTWMALPQGSKSSAFESSESSDPFAGFKREAVSDIARPWGMSYNVAACNSSDSNFSSGKLDQRLYGRHMELEQEEATGDIVDPVFQFWMFAAKNGRTRIIPDDSAFDWEQSWSWPMLDDPDPAKTATADASDIENLITSVRTVQMRRKVDPDVEERRCATECGMTVEEFRKARGQRLFQTKGAPPPVESPADLQAGTASLPSQYRRVQAAFDESKVKRDDDGKFGSGGGSGASQTATKASPRGAKKFTTASGRTYVKHPHAGSNETVVMVDLAKLDSAWSKDSLYLGSQDKGIDDRRQGVADFLKTKQPIQSPRIYFDKSKGKVSVRDGRHRLAVLRESGEKMVAVTVPRHEAKALQQAMGSSEEGTP